MVLSTLGTDENGVDAITTRTVLLKDVSQGGFTFFSNYGSRKAQAIELNAQVTLLFPWYAMERQVIITARAEKVPRGESEEYFASRPWSSQIGAWASDQSMEITGREVLEKRWQEISERYPEGSVVPLPENWGGFCAIPHSIEFWQGRYSRLHDRIRFIRSNDGTWLRQRLAP